MSTIGGRGGDHLAHGGSVDELVGPRAAQPPALVRVLLERLVAGAVEPPVADLGERLPNLDEGGEALADNHFERREVDLLAGTESGAHARPLSRAGRCSSAKSGSPL